MIKFNWLVVAFGDALSIKEYIGDGIHKRTTPSTWQSM
jgi:hypothetical protein